MLPLMTGTAEDEQVGQGLVSEARVPVVVDIQDAFLPTCLAVSPNLL
jgi:hypothetical protein